MPITRSVVDDYVNKLKRKYELAGLQIRQDLWARQAKGGLGTYQELLLKDIDQEMAMLRRYSDTWVYDAIPASYEVGMDTSYQAFRAANVDVTKIAVNQGVVHALMTNASGMLEDANQFVGRRLHDGIRQAGIEAIANKVMTGSTVLQAKKNLLQIFSDRGITAITDKRGREIKMDVYAEMVARTTTREATNKGMISAVQDVGRDLVKMSHHNTACPICAPLEGRIYSISGKDKRYPSLKVAFPSGYATIHPNCRHVLEPYIEEFDDNFDENLASSNRPFKLDEAQTKKLDAYYKDQKIKADRRVDRNEWERAQLLAGDITPKTFSGYRAGKRANSKKYQAIQAAIKPLPRIVPRITSEQEIYQSLKAVVDTKTMKIVSRPMQFKQVSPQSIFGNPALLDENPLRPFTQGGILSSEGKLKYLNEVLDIYSTPGISSIEEMSKAIERFTGSDDYIAIRKFQMGGKIPATIFNPDSIPIYSKGIEDYIVAAPKWGGEMYRGIRTTKELSISVGDLIDMKGTSSWSSVSSKATEFATGWKKKGEPLIGSIFKLEESSQAASIATISHFGLPESEVLLSKDAALQVIKIIPPSATQPFPTYVLKEVIK